MDELNLEALLDLPAVMQSNQQQQQQQQVDPDNPLDTLLNMLCPSSGPGTLSMAQQDLVIQQHKQQLQQLQMANMVQQRGGTGSTGSLGQAGAGPSPNQQSFHSMVGIGIWQQQQQQQQQQFALLPPTSGSQQFSVTSAPGSDNQQIQEQQQLQAPLHMTCTQRLQYQHQQHQQQQQQSHQLLKMPSLSLGGL
jgi:hypothetical protein